MSDRTQGALDLWETKLASAHGWDIDHDTMLAIITVNEAARRVANPDHEAAWVIFKREFPCQCDEAYKARELFDPQCFYHQMDPEIMGWFVDAALGFDPPENTG